MAIIYVDNNQVYPPGNNPNIAAFVGAAQANPTGPMPLRALAGTPRNLGQTQQAAQAIRSTDGNKTIAFGLLSCAAVIYASTDPNAARVCWVHHAPSGAVTAADVNNARAQLGNPPWGSIIVVLAHPGPHDNDYLRTTNTIANQGVPANNIIEIPDGPANFGVNYLGQLGT